MAQSSKVTLPTAADWIAQIKGDVELAAIDAGVEIPPTAAGSEIDLKATALGNSLAVLTGNQVITDADANPYTAEEPALDEIREADGLPVVAASAATGRVRVTVTSLSSVTILDGTGLLCPGALLAKTTGTATGVVNNSEVQFTMSKAGSAGNLKAGTIVRFTAQPAGVATEAVVVADMTGGADDETPAKKRRRILNRRQNPPKADNPSRLRELVLSATNAVDNAYVYPALGGRATSQTAVSAPWYIGASGGQSRVVPTTTLNLLRNTYTLELPTDDRLYTIKSTADEPTDIRLGLRLLSGNAGWIDSTTWPAVQASISNIVSNTQFRITSTSDIGTVSPGKNIAVWDTEHMAFRTSVVQTVLVAGSTFADVIVSPWIGGAVTIVSGMWVSPAAGNLAAWASAWLDIVGKQTAGETCYTWQEPRSLRYPIPSSEEPVGIGSRETNQLTEQFDEIANAEILTISTATPTRSIPAGAPNILTLRKLSLGPI